MPPRDPADATSFENPIATRPPLARIIPRVDPSDPQDRAVKKVVESQVATVTRLDQMDSDLVDLGQRTMLGFASVEKKIDVLVQNLGHRAASPPPPRGADDSSHDWGQRIGAEAASKVSQIIDDPNSELTPGVVRDLVASEVAGALAAAKEKARIATLEAERAAEEKRVEAERSVKQTRDRERRELWRLIVATAVGGIVVLIAGVFIAYTQGKLTGHGEGFREREEIPPQVVPVPIIVPSGAMPMLLDGATPRAAPSAHP